MKPTIASRKYLNVSLLFWNTAVNGSLDGNLQDLNGSLIVKREKLRKSLE